MMEDGKYECLAKGTVARASRGTNGGGEYCIKGDTTRHTSQYHLKQNMNRESRRISADQVKSDYISWQNLSLFGLHPQFFLPQLYDTSHSKKISIFVNLFCSNEKLPTEADICKGIANNGISLPKIP
ncbi:hypothetical protein EGR_10814 [Echinococcus granulosus]|uniref:Uncharacterized protein n=1 Tax=Echinococcus granulosus TaxID=6210 RepID=W6U1E2_ECHGR|nr:hypothetical protein EGR_10814 [Echinococcus granulosus]EUB54326.1 hypothetical protein EGR_10814 [Echinococcus granulosus]